MELKKFNNIKSEDPEKINKFCNTAVKQLASKYESPENLNKINEAMNQIEDTRLIVEQNLKKVVDNTANLDVIVGYDMLGSRQQSRFIEIECSIVL